VLLRGSSRILLLTALVVVLAAAPLAGQSDEFSSTTLSPQWFWVRENKSRWSLTESTGYMRMYTYGDIWMATNTASLLLQSLKTPDFEASASVTISPTAHAQQAGLLVCRDDDNYIRVSRICHGNTGQGIEMVSEIAGQPAQTFVSYSPNTVHLKITKKGNTCEVLFSQNGLKYQPIGTANCSLGTGLMVGLFAINGVGVSPPSIPADFDFFRIAAVDLQGSGAPRPGGAITLTITATNDAGLAYQVGSSLGTGPIPIDNRDIDLGPDWLLMATVMGYWPAIFSGYRGVIDPKGQAQATINIPNVAMLIGIHLHTAFVTVSPSAPSGIKSISNTFSFTITQ
jgi:regulation of enolase protein 1 (concanavalin A-like superfamily)